MFTFSAAISPFSEAALAIARSSPPASGTTQTVTRSAVTGTCLVPYQKTVGEESDTDMLQDVTAILASITAMPFYQGKSQEELR